MTAVLFQSMPPLSPEEYAALEASISTSGVQVPVIVDEFGVVIDGHHRKRIAESLGIEYPTIVRAGLSDTEKRTLALSLNVDRRHLSRDQRRELIAASLKADPHLSDREHARRTGASPTTVGSTRSELEQLGELSKLDSRISGDGRERPANQPSRLQLLDDPSADLDVDDDGALEDDVLDEGGPSNLPDVNDGPPKPNVSKKPSRKAITEQAADLGWDFRKIADRLARLVNDDRLPTNEKQVADALRGHLLYVAETVAAVLDQLP